jgi:uncharacterized protein with HEPN domain
MFAVAFAFGQIGELAKMVSAGTIEAHPHIQWKGMRGLRNRIVHDYDNVDLKVLWETIRDDLPILLLQVREIVNNEWK